MKCYAMLQRLGFVALGLLCLMLQTSQAQDVTYANDVMQKFSLTKQGSFWVLSSEAEVAKSFAAFPALEKKYTDETKKFTEVVTKAREATKNYDLAIAEYKKIEPLVKGGNPPQQAILRHNQLVAAIKQLEPMVVVLEAQDLHPTYQEVSVAYSKARNDLTLAFLNLKENQPKLDQQYQELKTNEEIQAAMKILGPMGQKLGPAKSYKLDARKATMYDAQLLGPNFTLTRNDEQLVIYGIINESKSFPFGWSYDVEPTLLQARDLAEVGITPPESAPKGQLTIGDNKIDTRIMTLNIRFGKHLLRDVEVLVLPPEAKEYGNIIGSKALGEYNFTRLPKDYMATIRAPGETDAPATKGKK